MVKNIAETSRISNHAETWPILPNPAVYPIEQFDSPVTDTITVAPKKQGLPPEYWQDTLAVLKSDETPRNDVTFQRPKLEAPAAVTSIDSAAALGEMDQMLKRVKGIDSDALILRLLFKSIEVQRDSRESSVQTSHDVIFREQEIQKKKQKEGFALQELISAANQGSTVAGWIDLGLKVGLVVTAILGLAISLSMGIFGEVTQKLMKSVKEVLTAAIGVGGVVSGVNSLVDANYKYEIATHTSELLAVQREREISQIKMQDMLHFGQELIEHLAKYVTLQRQVLKNSCETALNMR